MAQVVETMKEVRTWVIVLAAIANLTLSVATWASGGSPPT